jgi:hypothetical protein
MMKSAPRPVTPPVMATAYRLPPALVSKSWPANRFGESWVAEEISRRRLHKLFAQAREVLRQLIAVRNAHDLALKIVLLPVS